MRIMRITFRLLFQIAPNVTAMIELFDKRTYWVATEILQVSFPFPLIPYPLSLVSPPFFFCFNRVFFLLPLLFQYFVFFFLSNKSVAMHSIYLYYSFFSFLLLLQRENPVHRMSVIKKLIEVAEECKNLCNFNTLFEVMFGLAYPAVKRLKSTWEGLPNSSKGYLYFSHYL